MKPILFCCLLAAFSLPAQVINLDGGATRAVVIGISDYQDNGIPDLHFADRDAQAFADWLQSAAGGKVPTDNIRLLTDEKATNGAIIMALYALIQECGEGDQVVIFFSGHGDVDSKIISQDGYLLAYDTPASVYMAGAVGLDNLQKIVTTLSVNKKANVLVITDACHAGKLAGSSINGAQLTGANLAEQFAGESKILSCQPNEYSLEGEQWGGGRGVFSWFLLKGLTGLADKDGNGRVSLNEIDRYLGDVVPPETSVQPQTPFTVGDRNAIVALVNKHLLDSLRATEVPQADIQKITPKGLEDDVLAKADSATRQEYRAFKNALASGDLLEPAAHSAWDLFQQLSANVQIAPLHRLMRHNLAVALLDEVQQALNALLTDDQYEVNQWRFNKEKYEQYPELVRRAIELLGKEHPLYHSLEAKRLFFEAYNLSHYSYGYWQTGSDSLQQASRRLLHEALRHDSLAPYLHYLLGNSLGITSTADSILNYFQKTMRLAPAWGLPKLELANTLLNFAGSNPMSDFYQAGQYIREALAYHPDSYQALEMLAWWYQRYDRVDSIEAVCRRMRALRPDMPNDYATLGYTHYFITKQYPLANHFWQKAIALDSVSQLAVALKFWISDCLVSMRRFDEGKKQLAELKGVLNKEEYLHLEESLLFWYYYKTYDWKRALSLLAKTQQSGIFRLYDDLSTYSLGKFLALTENLDSAEVVLRTLADKGAENFFDLTGLSLAWLGFVAHERGQDEQAEAFFQKAVSFHPELWVFYSKGDGAEICQRYGDFLLDKNRLPEAEEKYRKSIEVDYGNYIGYYAMARLKAKQKRHDEALDYLELALDRWYPIPKPILEEPLFKKIRKTKRFEALLKKHFPDQTKD